MLSRAVNVTDKDHYRQAVMSLTNARVSFAIDYVTRYDIELGEFLDIVSRIENPAVQSEINNIKNLVGACYKQPTLFFFNNVSILMENIKNKLDLDKE